MQLDSTQLSQNSTQFGVRTVPEILKTCPVCQHDLVAVRLECDHCDTGIDGHFEPAGLAGLSVEQLEFADVFIRNRGIIRDVEAELGVSYPTVRSMLDGVVDAMERRAESVAVPDRKKSEVLESLRDGEIDVDEALKLLGSERSSNSFEIEER